jgi:RES domain-containing protein
MYEGSLYEYDRENDTHTAKIRDNAYLYRLTSLTHCGVEDVLTGRGPLKSPVYGRFNVPHQRATYCANNALVSIAEVLYHRYRLVLDRVSGHKPYEEIKEAMTYQGCLVILRVAGIDDLVYVDCKGVRYDFDARFGGTTVTFPDSTYEPFWSFQNTVRSAQKKGVIYPSARHSQDVCIALFYDETSRIKPDFYEALTIKIQLVAEDQDPFQPPRKCNPLEDKLHATMGYYSFLDEKALDKARSAGVLHPNDIPAQGMVDFVRRRYTSYPRDAVR